MGTPRLSLTGRLTQICPLLSQLFVGIHTCDVEEKHLGTAKSLTVAQSKHINNKVSSVQKLAVYLVE